MSDGPFSLKKLIESVEAELLRLLESANISEAEKLARVKLALQELKAYELDETFA